VRRNHVFAAAATAALLVPAGARAGGVPVQLAAVGSTLWSVSDSGLLAVDPRTGTIVARPAMPYASPVRIAAGAGALWVASVANGYGEGAVTRIDGRRRRATTRLRLRRQGVYDVCAGGGAAWAVVGPARGRRVARLDASGGRTRFVGLGAEPAWCAADGGGAWVTTEDGRLLRVDGRTSGVSEVRGARGLSQLTVGRGAVWALGPGAIVRVDARTEAVTRIALRGMSFAIAAGRSGVWALVSPSTGPTSLVRVDLRTGRVDARRRLPGTPTSVLETRDALWVGGLDRRGHPVLLRLDARSLAVRRVSLLL
jgi:hypothetical protein